MTGRSFADDSDNEAEIAELIAERHENAADMTAVDDLQSYQKITQAHADALQKMITSFQTLYNEMPDSQKKNAGMKSLVFSKDILTITKKADNHFLLKELKT